MSLTYAVERLYQAGWKAGGRGYPSVEEVQREFAEAGLALSIKRNFMFNCVYASWAPQGENPDGSHPHDERHGTVVGESENEAAVYALAQLLEQGLTV